ncbi:hypothetical protein AB0A70_06755 [Streptomyces morookaense]|uniref:hypothetical protein n=1 Tax=Streptomyces morookaense TaxID=1970 RepID=UPI0033F6D76B
MPDTPRPPKAKTDSKAKAAKTVAKVAPNPAVRKAAKAAASVPEPRKPQQQDTSKGSPSQRVGSLIPSGSGSSYRAVKAEFVLAMLLLLLYPLAVKDYQPKKWAKRIIALWITFVILLTVAKLKGALAAVSAGLGGLIVLGLLVYGGNAQEGLLVSGTLGSLAKTLQSGSDKDATKASTDKAAPTIGQAVSWPTGESVSWPAPNSGFGSGSGTSNNDNGELFSA